MKLRTPFTILSNPLRDIDRLQDFSYKFPEQKVDFWESECRANPTKSACKRYEV